MRNITPVVNISRTNIHYECKKQKPRRRIKTTPLQILDHALPYLLLWQSPMHCAVRCIFTYMQVLPSEQVLLTYSRSFPQ